MFSCRRHFKVQPRWKVRVLNATHLLAICEGDSSSSPVGGAPAFLVGDEMVSGANQPGVIKMAQCGTHERIALSVRIGLSLP